MRKEEYMKALRSALSGLPQGELEKSLQYYSESIDDRIEDGASEEDAVAAMGTVEEAVEQVLSVVPLQKLVREKVRPHRALRAWEIVLLVLGAPAWIPLVLAVVAVLLSVYLVLWSIVIILINVELSLVLGAAACVVGAVYFLVQSFPAQAGLSLGAGLITAGIAVFGFFLCHAAIQGTIWLSKKIGLGVKSMFVGKERTA